MNQYSKCACLKIHVDKIQRKYIGSLLSGDYFPHRLSWIKSLIEILSIVIIDSEENNYK